MTFINPTAFCMNKTGVFECERNQKMALLSVLASTKVFYYALQLVLLLVMRRGRIGSNNRLLANLDTPALESNDVKRVSQAVRMLTDDRNTSSDEKDNSTSNELFPKQQMVISQLKQCVCYIHEFKFETNNDRKSVVLINCTEENPEIQVDYFPNCSMCRIECLQLFLVPDVVRTKIRN